MSRAWWFFFKNNFIWEKKAEGKKKAEWEYRTKVDVAKELAKVNVPQLVVSGGNGGSSPMDAIGIKFLMDINKQLSEDK